MTGLVDRLFVGRVAELASAATGLVA